MIKQAAQVLELLEFFARIQRPAALAEVSEALDWPRSSTFNMLATLKSLGYLYEPRPKGGLYPSPRWYELIEAIRIGDVPPAETGRLLDHLVQTTSETAALAAPNGGQAMFVDVRESPFPIRYATQVGTCVPLHATASGRALLSLRSPAERRAALSKAEYVRYTEHTPMTADDIEADIEQSIQRGWFSSIEEYSPGLMGVALAVPMPGRHYALIVSGPTERLRSRIPEVVDLMRDAVREMLGIDLKR